MISTIMEKGKDYNQVPICIVLFIMDGNPFGKRNIPYQSFSPFHGNESFQGNDSRIMIFNGKYEVEDEISYLMKDFHQSDYEKIRNKPLRESVLYYTKGGNAMIYNPLQEHYEMGYNEGHLLGKKEGKLEGMMEGKMEGKMEGRLEGKEEAKEESCISFLKDGVYSP
jgi:hypothetical protein